jgi:hypothetical protein
MATNSGPYLHKATSSVSRASRIVGNFPTGQDTDDYATGLQHIAHLHKSLGGYTIYQVLAEGRAVRSQATAARRAEEQRIAEAKDAMRRAQEAHLLHGDPDCLVLDDRTLSTESDEYVGYVKGVVKNTCDRNFGYVQVEINFYHADGSLANSGLANVNNLDAGNSWSFKTIVPPDSEGGRWRVEKISAM